MFTPIVFVESAAQRRGKSAAMAAVPIPVITLLPPLHLGFRSGRNSVQELSAGQCELFAGF